MNLRRVYVPYEMPTWWFYTSSILVGFGIATLLIMATGGF